MAEESTNALGLDFSELSVNDKKPEESQEVPATVSPSQTAPDASKKENREKPYLNPERVKTGGTQRDKLSNEALEERMARIREQNEKIKQRRLDVQADEEAFRKTQEVERAKQAQARKIQTEIDHARDQNAKRKMDKVQSREWDSGKPTGSRSGQYSNRQQLWSAPAETEQGPAAEATSASPATPEVSAEWGGNWTRGGHPPPHPRGRGRGRGRGGRGGRGGANDNRRDTAQPVSEPQETPKTEKTDPTPST